MKTITIKAFTVLALVATGLTSCVKTGPVGPSGRDGLDGRDGLNGSTTEVISSPWLYTSVWSGSSEDWYFNLDDAEFTEDIVENGVILAYVKPDKYLFPQEVWQLPASTFIGNFDYFIPHYGTIQFMSTRVDPPYTNDCLFRYILIPANVYLKSAKLKSSKAVDYKSMTYAEVCKTLGIKE